jgi:hypothetical protein
MRSAKHSCFNPSRGIAIIQTLGPALDRARALLLRFNPSRGIAIIQTKRPRCVHQLNRGSRFNPSRGIAIIQTRLSFREECCRDVAFQSLTRDSNHSNTRVLRGDVDELCARFNPSRGIAIIQTAAHASSITRSPMFQSLTRDSNHSNRVFRRMLLGGETSFNPSRGIAIIQTTQALTSSAPSGVSIPHAG